MSLVAAFFVCFFSWVFFGGKLLVGGDAFVYNYPLRAAAWDALRRGELPLWTPAVFSGYPLLSMSQLGLAYPLTWGYAFLPGGYAEELFVLAPFLLAPAFTYAYARQVGRSRLAALLAGLAFAYGGVMVSPLTTGGMQTNALMWLPLVLVAAERARAGRFVPCLVGATAAYSMSVLTGHGQSFLYAGLLANAYGAFLSLAARDPQEKLSPSPTPTRAPLRLKFRPLAVTACGTLCGAGVGAFQILETLRAQRRSIRAAIDYDYFASGSFTFRARGVRRGEPLPVGAPARPARRVLGGGRLRRLRADARRQHAARPTDLPRAAPEPLPLPFAPRLRVGLRRQRARRLRLGRSARSVRARARGARRARRRRSADGFNSA
jgi:hypothetical protein